MDPTVHRGVPAHVATAVLDWLPDSEFAASLLDDTTRCVEVRTAGTVVAVALVAEDRPSYSGAPLVVACAGDAAAAAALSGPVGSFVATAHQCQFGGPAELTRAVASGTAAALGGDAETLMDQRLLITTAPVAPTGVPGAARRTGPDDEDLLVAWFDAFAVEALGRSPRDRDHWAGVLAEPHWRLWLWEVDGTPVSMVNSRQSTSVSSRIGPVYTPPAERGRGYAGALTAAVAGARLDDGDERVTLFTDAANATSNAVYTRVGFTDIGAHGAWLVTVP